jgi:hypothetical protein
MHRSVIPWRASNSRVRGCRTKARVLPERMDVDSMMRMVGGQGWAASSRARVRPVGPAPMIRISRGVILMFRRGFEGSGRRKKGNVGLCWFICREVWKFWIGMGITQVLPDWYHEPFRWLCREVNHWAPRFGSVRLVRF